MDIQKEREAFEAWLFKEYPNAKDFMIVYRPDENIYEHRPTQVRWEAWQAAKAQAVQAEFEIGQLKDRITELLDERQDLYAQINAQAVPEHTNQTFEDWLSDPENTKVYLGGYRERANEFAHQAWIASLKAKLPKDKILMPRSLDQKHIDYVVHQLAISSGASLISEIYECLIEAQEPAND